MIFCYASCNTSVLNLLFKEPLKTLAKKKIIFNMKQKGFFDENDRLAELSRMGDPLEKLNKYIQWENFRETYCR